MRVAICAIAKMENHYIREWVEYYKNIGIDKIFLYDNNDIEGERFDEVIKDYIDSGFVEITDFRGRESSDDFNLQSFSYEDCYTRQSENFEWFLIIDCDELLNIGGFKSIKDLLQQDAYKSFDGIRFQWMDMTDNDLVNVIDNDYSLEKRFTKGFMSYTGKTVVRSNLKKITKYNGHCFYGCDYCDALGNPCDCGTEVHKYIVNTNLYIKHYRTKTIEEWINIKMNRLYPDQTKEKAKSLNWINSFFRRNTKTEEKIKYIKEHINDEYLHNTL